MKNYVFLDPNSQRNNEETWVFPVSGNKWIFWMWKQPGTAYFQAQKSKDTLSFCTGNPT